MSQLNAARVEPVQEGAAAGNADVADLTTLPNLIKTWKTLQDETKELQAAMREKKTRLKAMEEMILQSMKRNNIGALDLIKVIVEVSCKDIFVNVFFVFTLKRWKAGDHFKA
jgi:hypothetical protein